MKRGILLLILFALLLGGCAGKPAAPAETSPAAQAGTVSAFPAPPAGGERRDVAFTCYSYDYDLYPGYCADGGMVFNIAAREYVDPAQIYVSIPAETPYTIWVHEKTGLDSLESYSWVSVEGGYEMPSPMVNDPAGFTFPLYQAYRGVDWDEVDRLEAAMGDALLAFTEAQQTGAATDTLEKAYYQAKKDWDLARTVYMEDYMALTTEDLPEFHYYQVEVHFDRSMAVEETIREIEIRLGQSTYPVEIGEIRIRTEVPLSSFEDAAFYPFSGGGIGCESEPYGDGMLKVSLDDYCAEEDITLTGLSIMEGSVTTAEIRQIHVWLGEGDRHSGIAYNFEMLWDGKSPLTIPAGSLVRFELEVYDPRLKEMYYGGQLYTTITYEHNGDSFLRSSGASLTRLCFLPWEIYAIGLDGLDGERYYTQYKTHNLDFCHTSTYF